MHINIYREHILDHYKNPRNYGKIEHADFKSKESNIFCGDSVEITGKLKGKKIQNINFCGRGCVISQASASILTESVKNKHINSIDKLTVQDVIKMLGVSLSAMRMKCAELPLIAIKRAINEAVINSQQKRDN